MQMLLIIPQVWCINQNLLAELMIIMLMYKIVLKYIKYLKYLKYINKFFRSLELPLVICKIDLKLTWHKDCMISSVDAAAGQVASFMITNTKFYIPIVTLSTKDNNNLTKQLNDGFKRSICWNRYVSKPFPETPHKKI